MGFITVNTASNCEPFDKEASSFFSSTGQYCFKLSDGTVEVTFAATGENDRVRWVAVIREAIDGAIHKRPDSSFRDNGEKTERPVSKRISAAREGLQAVIELPRKVGELSKKTIVGKFGIKTPKKR